MSFQLGIPGILSKQNKYINELKNRLEKRDEEVEQLLQKVLSLEVQQGQHSEPSSKASKVKTREKKSIVKNKSSRTPSTRRNKKDLGPNQTKSSSTPKRSASAPLQTPKPKENQLIMNQTPQGFKPMKDSFFAHIQIMWGLIYERSIPVLPDPALLQEFRNRFDDVEEIQQAAQSKNSLNLIPQEDVITLKGTKPGRKKVGRAIVNVQEFFILYIKALLAKLGIRRWAPALDEPIDTLYNEACRISAIQTFRQVAVAGAYQYMNINLRFLNNIGLLEATYNHFVHYLQTKIWKRETKESGAYQKDLERGVISKNRQRVRGPIIPEIMFEPKVFFYLKSYKIVTKSLEFLKASPSGT
ncbi:hypothetical protein O181_083552 [Austropuccinia psidii MF-1]|uniref:Uncharacterized protein n=1 Tax=Austropuccinia psidii MF-1 TaxID=1389203 RepID=A0A9Q3IK72_9BASI|nr:hypothetical protein [Austropuccinia psidii MF-1]